MAASRRSCAPSLPSSAATWQSTVRTDTTSSRAISRSSGPAPAAAARRSGARSARPDWPGFLRRPARDARHAQGVQPGADPVASDRASSSSRTASAVSRSAGSGLWASAAARSYRPPAACQAAAASRHRPDACTAYGCTPAPGVGRRRGQPVAEFRQIAQVVQSFGFPVHGGQVPDGRVVPAQPRVLGARRGGRSGALQLTAPHGQLPGLAEQLGGTGLAAADADPGHHGQRRASGRCVRVQAISRPVRRTGPPRPSFPGPAPAGPTRCM